MERVLNRIIIIGDAGRGKSTLASHLSKKLNISQHSTDDYYYEVKFTKTRDRQESLDRISKIYHEHRWIVEGTTQWLLKPGLDAADLVIYLRYRNVFQQWRAIFKRSLRREEERWIDSLRLMKHVFYKRYGLGYKKGKPTHSEVIAPHREKVLILTSFKAIDDFLDSL